MLTTVSPQLNPPETDIGSTKIIDSRELYRPCHVWLPNWKERIAAICVDKEYYSLFRAVKDAEETLTLVTKLGRKGNKTVITKVPKGYVIWVIETEAIPVK
jgi:hypothetical protein